LLLTAAQSIKVVEVSARDEVDMIAEMQYEGHKLDAPPAYIR
jgi:hypothetical protein